MSATLNKAIELLLTARNDGIDLVLMDGQLQVKVPRNKTVAPQLLQEIRENKKSLIDFLIREELKESEAPAIRRRADRDPSARIPLSFAQERLWFIERFGGSVPYHLPWVYRASGALNEEALRDAFRAVMDRHEVLRTVITGFEGVGAQEVKSFEDWDFTRIDEPARDEASLALSIQEFIDRPFDLSREPMVRALLATDRNGERLLVVVVHHIAFDGWSISVMVEELAQLYNARIRGSVAPLPPLPVQYADYALWQREVLSGPSFAARLAYWKQLLAGTEPLDLITDRPRPAQAGTVGGLTERRMNAAARQQLLTLAQEEKATSFMVLLAAFKALLHRYTGQSDICVGTPIAGRDRPEVEHLLGFFVNTLALRTSVRGDEDFSTLLQQVRDRALEAFEYKDVPFEKVVEALGVERDPARNPVFQVMFSMQNETAAVSTGFDGLMLTPERNWTISAKVDLHLNVAVTPDDLELSLVYRADLFDAATAGRLLLQYSRLLEAALAAPATPVGDLAILTSSEYDELLEQGRKNVCAFPLSTSIVSLISGRTATTPGAMALADGATQLDYAHLEQSANRLAAYLRTQGIGAGDRVAVSLPRSVDLAVSLLAIMKAGAAYLPIDPGYPADRIRYMLNDADVAAFLLHDRSDADVYDGTWVIGLKEAQADINEQSGKNADADLGPNDIAYLIYTSGSTGQPKGVAITHAGLSNLVRWHISAFDVDQESRATATAGIGFDAFGWELWPYLAAGASVRLIADEQRLALHHLLELFAAERITHSFIATALAADFVQASIGMPLHLRWLLTGGDRLLALPAGSVSYRIVNNYGPTENTVVATSYVLPENGRLPYPIGRPIANVQAYVLDARGRLALPGTAGELCLGGAQLAAGYWNRAELTAEKFIADPFSSMGNRLYRTGDRVRWLPDGELEYLGRVDEQVKLRGYRIEPGEISHLLQQAPGVQAACVLLHEGSAATELVGFVVAGTWNEEAVLAFLRDRLPAYMVPSLLERVTEIPLTPNGKTDRARLLRELRRTGNRAVYEAPRTVLESELAACWGKLLGRERIGIRDDFFALGGHSLLAMRLSAAVRALTGVDLPVRRIFEHPTIAALSADVQVAKSAALPPVTVMEKNERMPLSYEQERLWFIDRLHGSTQYHVPWVLRLRGALDADRLQAALQAVLERHEVLRTVIGESNGTGYQRRTASADWRLRRSSMEEVTAMYGNLQQALEEYIRQPFDLSSDTPIRAWLIRCGEDEHLLAGVVHHIAFDGWSTGLLVRDLAAFYAGDTLEALPVQYSDYAIWQRKYVAGALLDRKLAYWRSQLEGVEPLGLLTDFPRPAEPSVRGDVVSSTLTIEQLKQLRRLAQEEGVTLFMTLAAAFNTLLYRYTGQSDICIGTPVAGRQQKELEGLIGFFLNTLALRSDVQAGASFRELLQQVRKTTLDAYEHQEVPFEKIVETLGVPRDRSRSAIFQVWIVLQNLPAAGDLDLGDITIGNEQPSALTAQFDLNLDITESEEGLRISLTYASDLYRRETATYLLDHYVQILVAVLADRSVSISALPMVSDAERALIRNFNNTAPAAPEQTLAAAFDKQAQLSPSAIALRCAGAELTYAALHERVDALARHLAARGVRRGTRVGLCLPKSISLITGLLAILEAGGAYVPIDPEYPAERIDYMVADSGCALVLTTTEHHQLFAAGIVLIDLDDESWTTAPSKEPDRPHPSDAAYIIYTSGSTGRPKGVLVAHRAVSALVASQQQAFTIIPQERILQFSNTSFDASVEQVFLALLSGAALVLLPKKIQLDLPAFEAMLDEEAITHLHATPGFLELLNPRAFAALRRVVAGGEACRSALARKWSGLVKFYNEYGPTETTVTATELLADDTYLYGELLPIGRPLSHVEAYLLEADRSPAGIGVPADLYLGGPQLAEGYVNQPGLTAQKFIEHEGRRLYATGDRARWLADGAIEFLGRADDQVKIRGYRIEPAEIATVLEEAPGVRQAVVLVQEEGREKRLAAFVVPAGDFDREAVLTFARTRLPEYMMPAALVETDVIPLNTSGKVDRKKLLDSFEIAPEASGYEAPRNATEAIMTEIWQELLEVERLGIHDNFFELGGHSLLAVRVAAAVRSRLDTEIAIVTIFEHSTVARLCRQLPAAADTTVLPPIRPRTPGERLPLSFAQERLWFIDKLQGSVQYHMPWLFRLEGRLDVAFLEAAFRTIADRHEILRTVIREEEGQGYQELLSEGSWSLRQTTAEAIEALGLDLEEYMQRQIGRPYDLSSDHPLSVTLVRLSPQEHLLLVVLHHIAFDGWSISVMVKELAALYNGWEEGRPASLAPLPVQYSDYALWQRTYLSGATLEGQLDYWKEKLAGIAPLELPVDHPRSAIQSTRGHTLGFMVDRDCLDRLRTLSQQQGATLFMTVSAVFKLLLHRYTGQEDIAIGTPVANRTQSSTDALIGFFVNTLVLRDDLGGDPVFTDLLQKIRTTALEAYAHQDTPFEKVVEAVAAERNMSYTPLFQVLFALQNTPQVPDLELTGVRLAHTPLRNTTAKFDLYADLLETPEGLQVQIEYSSDLFDAGTITRLFDHYHKLLQAVADAPHRRLSEYELLTPAETEALQRFNDTSTAFPDAGIVGLFEEQARQNPRAWAVVYGSAIASYATLNEQSNRLAHHLSTLGVKAGNRVMVCLDRSMEMIISVLAVLKAGAAYVPVDPRYPKERIAWMVQDAGAALIITTTDCQYLLGDTDTVVLRIDAERDAIMRCSSENPGIRPDAESLVYVIYTSGSTGRPKGVELPHRALTNLLLWQREQNRHFGVLRILQFASLNFDVSFQEIFSALCFGNSLHLIDEDRRKDMHEVVADIDSQQLTTLFIPYVVLKNLAEYAVAAGRAPLSLREIVTAGEQLKLTADIQSLVEKTGLRLVNQYGPSEAHVVSAYEVQPSDFTFRILPPIGKPVANTQLHILGPHGERCPVGIAGELYIGGVQVANGYLNRPDLTAERFVADPFSSVADARLYRTGDKARWLPDGTIEFLGRLDDQVKIHGYRIELGEVEAVLLQAPGVRQAVVLARADAQGVPRLVAYVAGLDEASREGAMAFVKERLPAYMVPALFVAVDDIPLTANGKADKRRLPDVEAPLPTQAYVAPRTDTEEKITAIWCALLGVSRVGIHDKFFEIGGHSLLVTRLASAIRKEFGLDLPVRSFFELATPAALATYIEVNRLPATFDADHYEAIEI